MNIGIWHGLWSLLILLTFISIVAFVWSDKRKSYYEQAGRIPLQDDKESND